MTFKELTEELHSDKPNPHYYQLLLQNSDTILLEIAKRNQGVVGRDLGINSTSKFSAIIAIIKEISTNPLKEV